MKTWILYLVIGAAFVLFYFSSQVERNEAGVIVGDGDLDAFAMKVGDCFDDSPEFEQSDTVEIYEVPGVPCSESHDNEVFAVFDVTLSEFPASENGMVDFAFDSCLAYFSNYVGLDYESSALDIMTLHPSLDSWQEDDREIVCALYDVELQQLEGSMKGLGI